MLEKLTPANLASFMTVNTARLLIFLCSAGVSGPALADCGPFSNLSFWSGMDHEMVKRNVQIQFNGDWQDQIAALEARQIQLKEIYARKSGVELSYKDKKIAIFDDELAAYIEQAETRLNVVECLAEAEEDMELPEMGTASGPEELTLAPSQ